MEVRLDLEEDGFHAKEQRMNQCIKKGRQRRRQNDLGRWNQQEQPERLEARCLDDLFTVVTSLSTSTARIYKGFKI